MLALNLGNIRRSPVVDLNLRKQRGAFKAAIAKARRRPTASNLDRLST